MFIELMVWIILTLILARLLYIIGITLYTYNLTDKRLKGFGNYRIPNIFFHGRVTAASRLVPYPTPHAMVSSCIYDVHRKSLRIKARVPEGVYWSLTFFGRNQDCYFTLNDLGKTYKKNKNEIIVSAPNFSKRGLILIRIIMMDPSDKEEIKRITNVQKMVTTEVLEID
jgi:uncharacterized membrane protein